MTKTVRQTQGGGPVDRLIAGYRRTIMGGAAKYQKRLSPHQHIACTPPLCTA